MAAKNLHLEEAIEFLSKPPEYYVLNTLVPKVDGCRWIGPLTKEEVVQKRKAYNGVTCENPEIRSTHPFLVYHLERTITEVEAP